MQTVWCCPPEKPTQAVVEFLKAVSFTGVKHTFVLWVPDRDTTVMSTRKVLKACKAYVYLHASLSSESLSQSEQRTQHSYKLLG